MNRFLLLLAIASIHATITTPSVADEKPERLEFTRMMAHWAGYGTDDYLKFIEEAEPELVQHGFYGGHFWSLAHTPQFSGYPAHFPVQGLDECGAWFTRRNKAIHAKNIKVIGHFNVEFLVGDPDGPNGPRGFFKFYRDHWDEKQLGPKPVADPLELLERGADGKPIINQSYRIGGMDEYWACLRNPHWQQVLRAWTKQAIQRGVDGLIINYFYKHDCHCEHCQRGFRKYLTDRYSNDELNKKFQITNLKQHKFSEMVYWHNPKESTPLRRELLRWSQMSNKQVFDDVFIKYGRSLKPKLIVAQWNHLGNFSQINGDERCLLPAQLWGKDEDYLWYSAGGSAFYTDLSKHFLGDVTLQARYIRGAFDDKPFTVGKYENTRIRSAISELAANGGAPMGFYTRFSDPAARQEIVRYYQFLKKFDSVFRGNRSHAEAALVFPRSRVHAGDVESVEVFRKLGKELLESHILFDVVPDDLATDERLAGYKFAIKAEADEEIAFINDANVSRFEAPFTVRVSASRPPQGDELTLHFVNYNRTEPPPQKNGRPNAGGGIKDEKPIAAKGIRADIVLPKEFRPGAVQFVTPENPQPVALKATLKEGRLSFALPEFLVYGVVRIHQLETK
ncbi:MAG: hypothetical protein HON53_02645 [Planctomycetaceae bacterium]|jgi:hypothetical protein|nr:hypothetical protein [Planctomycetaceae bacterium]MBT6153383.1 hypothetical protein [Planctomycetaceae bacterium]MBT6484032.1 hypothetical protein [Planctomycetaceae bacterium]MBT6493568.1 hypothetical protein [Planctomycetaceae bacterium]